MRQAKPLCSERLDKHGYTLIKVPHGSGVRYRYKHVWLWEQEHGPKPAGACILFVDGDISNCVLENLALVSRSELLALNRNGYADAPAQLRPTIFALSKLEARVGTATWLTRKTQGPL